MGETRKARDESKDRLTLAKNGVFAEEYSSSWFVRVKDASRIDRVRFSFVKMKTNGKVFFEVYVTLSKIRPLLEDMLSRAAYDSKYRVILTDGVRNVLQERSLGITEKGVYFYPSGTNGSRSLTVIAGNKPGSVVLSARGVQKGKGISTQVPIPDPRVFFGEILHGIDLVTGRAYVRPGSYEAGLLDAYEKKASEDEEYFNSLPSEEIEEVKTDADGEEPSDTADPAVPAEAVEAPKASAKEAAAPKKEEAKAAKEGQKERRTPINAVFRTEGEFFEVTGGKQGEPSPTKIKARIYVPETKEKDSVLSEIIFYDRQRKADSEWYGRTVALAKKGPVGIRIRVTPCGVAEDGTKQFVFQKALSSNGK